MNNRLQSQTPHNPLEGEKPELSIDLNSSTEEQISIIIVHKDRPEYLNICLQSIAVTSFNNNYELIVVDNASGQDSQDFLDEIEKEGVKVIRNEKNLYWSAAANKGLASANKYSKYFVFMHCDVVILNPSWLDMLINICEGNKCGMIGIQMQSYMMQGRKLDFISEWLTMYTKECLDECGPFPEDLPLVGPGFIMTVKANNKGFNPQAMKNNDQKIAHHYKIFSLDISEFERMTEQAMVKIPQLLRTYQTETIKRVI